MGVGKFDRNMPLPPRGAVTIKGPFNPQDRAVDAARVLFLIVQGEGADAVIINGEGTWNGRMVTNGAGRSLDAALMSGEAGREPWDWGSHVASHFRWLSSRASSSTVDADSIRR